MDSSDISILEWASKRAGKPAKSYWIDTRYYEGCPTCGDHTIQIEVYVHFEDGLSDAWEFDDFGKLLQEILDA